MRLSFRCQSLQQRADPPPQSSPQPIVVISDIITIEQTIKLTVSPKTSANSSNVLFFVSG